MDDLPESHRHIAEVIGIPAMIALCECYDGEPIYVPVIGTLISTIRATLIREEYNGSNVRELAKKYGIGVSAVYKLVQSLPNNPRMVQRCPNDNSNM